jgi:DNA-binding ferritin-like protein
MYVALAGQISLENHNDHASIWRNKKMTEVIERQASLSSLARDYLNAADGNTDAATYALMDELSHNRDLLRAIIDEAVAEAVRSLVGVHMRQNRSATVNQKIIRKSVYNPQKAVEELKPFYQHLYLDFRLKGGLKLRDATRVEVLDQASDYEKRENDAGIKRRWLQSIADRLSNNKQKVGKVITEELAFQLFEEAK